MFVIFPLQFLIYGELMDAHVFPQSFTDRTAQHRHSSQVLSSKALLITTHRYICCVAETSSSNPRTDQSL
jgi:hypothetical protein